MKRAIVPFFIAHQGCPHDCVFCDQRAITGSSGALPTGAEILATVGRWRASGGGEPVEAAFYGGSFTMLPREQQQRLLAPLQPLLATGEVSAIRISTRPDAVDMATARFLREAGVSLVELGVQSMDDEVLRLSARGHTSGDSSTAFEVLRSEGLRAGAQMMPGLPGESSAGAIASFRTVLALQPDLVRIYPAVVLRGTGLARLYADGSYVPLSLDGAVALCKVMLHDAARAGVPVIRVGLQPTDDLSTGTEVVAGPYHPAFRQLVQGERWYDLLRFLLREFAPGEQLTLFVSSGAISDVVGQKRRNVQRLEEASGVRVTAVLPDGGLDNGSLRIEAGERTVSGNLLADLRY